ncbi:fimbrial protein [Salmonella enterica]|nr:fimbrial protein [Salmonella enterica]
MKKVGFFLLLSLMVSSAAYARCSYYSGVTGEVPGYLHFGNVVVQRDAPVGSVLATAVTGAYNGGNPLAGCLREAFTGRFELTQWRTLSGYGNGVYNTNLPGVGLRLTGSQTGKVLPFDTSYGYSPSWVWVSIPGEGIKGELIKTGNITSGTLTNGVLARASIVNQFYFANVTLNGASTVSAAACTVTTDSVEVSLDKHDRAKFTGVGSTTAWKAFDIGLDCSTSARINVRIDPASGAVAGRTDVMNLDGGGGDGSASGIGVQLWFRPNGGSAVKFGQETYYWTSAYGGRETVQLQARYYQTTQSITAGKANATATFTLTYK